MIPAARCAWLLPLLAVVAARAQSQEPRHAASAPGAIDRIHDLVAEYGPPVLLVEPERPEHPHDRRASDAMAKALAEAGFRCADATEARGRRRELADGSVAGGGSPGRALAFLDRLDVDFVLRVSSVVRDAGSVDSYGIRLSAVECTVAASLVRAADQSTVHVEAVASTARSRSPDVAALDAEAAAVVEGAVRVADAVVADWQAAANGLRPWIVELDSPSAGDAGRLAAAFGDPAVVVLENRPGIRSILAVPGADAASRAQEAAGGTVVLRRPGYALVVPSRVPSWLGWSAIALAAAAVGSAAIVLRRRTAAAAVGSPTAQRG